MNPLFMVGNRRSGSTMMTYVLNTHPEVFMASELNVIWSLYATDKSVHPMDSSATMTSDKGEPFVELNNWDHDLIVSKFYGKLLSSKDRGIRNRQDPYPEKTDLKWIGDKSPSYNSDPFIYRWIMEHFPESKFIHLVRNPIFAVTSMVGTWWKGTPEDVADYWIKIEEWCSEIPSLFVRYEDVCEDYGYQTFRIWDYLGLDSSIASPDLKRGEVMGDGYHKQLRRGEPDIEILRKLEPWMERYGYDYP